jgi:hypothetical protein
VLPTSPPVGDKCAAELWTEARGCEQVTKAWASLRAASFATRSPPEPHTSSNAPEASAAAPAGSDTAGTPSPRPTSTSSLSSAPHKRSWASGSSFQPETPSSSSGAWLTADRILRPTTDECAFPIIDHRIDFDYRKSRLEALVRTKCFRGSVPRVRRRERGAVPAVYGPRESVRTGPPRPCPYVLAAWASCRGTGGSASSASRQTQARRPS